MCHEALLESGDELEVHQSDIFRKGEVEWMQESEERRDFRFSQFICEGGVGVCEQIDTEVFVYLPGGEGFCVNG